MTRREPELWVAFVDALAAYERREQRGHAPSRMVLTVWPDEQGEWRVELEGGEGISARFSGEGDAVRATRAFAAANAPSEVQVYDAEGKLRAQHVYTHDPLEGKDARRSSA